MAVRIGLPFFIGEKGETMTDKLNILWTTGDPVIAEKMILMYAINGKIHGWWDQVSIIIWGASSQLVAKDPIIQDHIEFALKKGVHISACKACADQLGTTSQLEALGIELKYWGQGLTDLLKSDQKLLSL